MQPDVFNGLAIGTLVVFGYSFLVASFILFPVKEKETKVGQHELPMCSTVYMLRKPLSGGQRRLLALLLLYGFLKLGLYLNGGILDTSIVGLSCGQT